MKKSSIIAITLLGTIGGILFAIGMCMCLLPEWNAFRPGLVLAVLGAAALLLIWPVYRKATGKGAVKIGGAGIAIAILGILGALALGIGLVICLKAVTIPGLVIGLIGLVLLLAIIPVARKAAGKGPIQIDGKRLLAYFIGILGTLALGIGMCLVMVWGAGYLIPGIVVGGLGLAVCALNFALIRIKRA